MGISVEQVAKRFHTVQALKGISFHLEKQKIYGLLGRNGAGKSTLLNVMTTRIFPELGKVLIDEKDPFTQEEALSQVFLAGEQNCYTEGMRVREAFRWSKVFFPGFDADYAKRLGESFGLPEKTKIRSLSTGYASIFKLVTALSVNTPYVLLDEPVLGLDANHRELFYRLLLEKYAQHPFTVVISTHLIEEIASLLEEVLILKEGKLLCQEPVEELLSRGYTVSGNTCLVEQYVQGRQVLGTDQIGGLCSAYVLGAVDPESLPEGLELSRLDLQKLFIQMTS